MTELPNCALIGVCAVIRSNMVISIFCKSCCLLFNASHAGLKIAADILKFFSYFSPKNKF